MINAQELSGKAGQAPQYLDSTSGLYDMRLRDYSASNGRFTNSDPIKTADGTAFAQTYHYALNSVTTLNDPSGGCPWCAAAVLGGIVGAAIGGISAALRGENVMAGIGTGLFVGVVVGATGGLGLGAAMAAGGLSSIAAAGYSSYANHRSFGWADVASSFATGAVTGAAGFGLSQIRPSAWLASNTISPLPASQKQAVKCASESAPVVDAVPGATQVQREITNLPNGRSGPNVKMVQSEQELRALYSTITKDGEPFVISERYPGSSTRLDDGTIISIRDKSRSGGSTIDIRYPNGTERKVGSTEMLVGAAAARWLNAGEYPPHENLLWLDLTDLGRARASALVIA